jgi:hypothetical protein
VQELAVLMTMLEAEPAGRRAHAHAPQDAEDTEPAEKRVHYRELERLFEDYVRARQQTRSPRPTDLERGPREG